MEFVLVKYDVLIGNHKIQGSPVAIALGGRSLEDAVDDHFKSFWNLKTVTIEKSKKYIDPTSGQALEISRFQELNENQMDTFIRFGLHSEK
ncbi:hypothetical protein AAGG74_17600 [Bacillus mexicanus]|uniref:hypothetical protein n=1 Tax=Bacillus mexicanus TaxID=2834415 RepID=UPI003D1C7887